MAATRILPQHGQVVRLDETQAGQRHPQAAACAQARQEEHPAPAAAAVQPVGDHGQPPDHRGPAVPGRAADDAGRGRGLRRGRASSEPHHQRPDAGLRPGDDAERLLQAEGDAGHHGERAAAGRAGDVPHQQETE